MAGPRCAGRELSLNVRIAVVLCVSAVLALRLNGPTTAGISRLLYHDEAPAGSGLIGCDMDEQVSQSHIRTMEIPLARMTPTATMKLTKKVGNPSRLL